MQVLKVFSPFIHVFLITFAFSSCKHSFHMQSSNPEMYVMRDSLGLAAGSRVDSLIQVYKAPIAIAMDQQIGLISKPALKDFPEGSLGNFISDLIRGEIIDSLGIPVDACILNTGGLRVEWQEGPILLSHVYEMMPFDNEMVLVKMSGTDLKILLDQLAGRGGAPVSGIRFVIEDNLAKDILVGGTDLQDEIIYNVLTSDYLLQGGDKYTFPKNTEQLPINRKVRDVIKDGLYKAYTNGVTLTPMKDGRIQKR